MLERLIPLLTPENQAVVAVAWLVFCILVAWAHHGAEVRKAKRARRARNRFRFCVPKEPQL